MPYEGVPCSWLEPTGRQGVVLRRYASLDEPCPARPARGYHNADSPVLDYRPLVMRLTEHGEVRESVPPVARTDPRWPTVCECGYAFTPDDNWQTNGPPEWRYDSGELVVAEAHGLPPGALFHLDWSPLAAWTDRYQDGINLHGICPNRSIWNIDGPAYSSGAVTTPEAWQRVGDPRHPAGLTVTPSIVAGDYHGFLQAGAFTSG